MHLDLTQFFCVSDHEHRKNRQAGWMSLLPLVLCNDLAATWCAGASSCGVDFCTSCLSVPLHRSVRLDATAVVVPAKCECVCQAISKRVRNVT